MATLYTRIRRRIDRTIKDFRSDCRFSTWFAVLRMTTNLFGRAGLSSLARNADRQKDEYIHTYLSNTLAPVLEQYAANQDAGTPAPDAPIWVCWWTGEETAPPLVKRCIRSIRENAGPHPVRMVTRDTYREYLEIPDFMLKKVDSKQMGLAHLADYIRVRLLAEYGGLWLDATMFCSGPVPDLCFELPFFTCKSPRRPCGCVSEMRWTTFCLGGWKGNVFFRFLTAAFEHYWRESPCAVDYLFFDYTIELAYNQLPALRKLIDAVPENNLHRDDLQAAMNAALPAADFDSVIHPDTTLYKLSWRETYSTETPNGEASIYSYFIS